MGYRTLVVFNNDYNWANDPELGKKIMRAAQLVTLYPEEANAKLEGVRVVECVHADVSSLMVIDDFGAQSFTPLARSSWRPGLEEDEKLEALLREAADKLGYDLVKRST